MNLIRIHILILFFFNILSAQGLHIYGTTNIYTSDTHDSFFTNNNVYDTINTESYLSNIFNLEFQKNKFTLTTSVVNDFKNVNLHKLSFQFHNEDHGYDFGLVNIKENNWLPQKSSGHMLVSKNAAPVYGSNIFKKFKFEKFNLTFSMFNGILSSLNSYEWNGTYIKKIPTSYPKEPYIHVKSLSLRKNLKNDNFVAFVFNHGAIWGGSTKKYSEVTDWPTNFEAFQRVFFIRSGINDSSDERHKIANHNGSFDFYFKNKKLLYYYLHYFEDGSGVKFKNNFDGLWGLNYKEEKYNIIIEYLNTTHQSGNFHGKNGIGVDSYYWHDQYVQGWAVEGQVIGNYILSPDNNRIEMFLFGFNKIINNENLSIEVKQINEFLTYGKKVLPQDFNSKKIVNKKNHIKMGYTINFKENVNYQINFHNLDNKFLFNFLINWNFN